MNAGILGAPFVDVASGTPFDWAGPILSTGAVGLFLLMILFRIKIMPTYVHEDAKKEWERERVALELRHEVERQHDQADIAALKQAVQEGNDVYTQQVIPLLTRLLDSEKELVELRRDEARRRSRGQE